MTRRRNDPLGFSDRPKVTTDPVRIAEIEAEARRRIKYLKRHYQMEVEWRLGRKEFNEDLARLKASIKGPSDPNARESRLNGWLETAINVEARKLAGLPADEVLRFEHGSFVRQAAVIVAKRGKALRGSPGHVHLRPYVEGLMAISQECTGGHCQTNEADDSGPG